MYFMVIMKNNDEDVYRFAIKGELWRKKERKRERGESERDRERERVKGRGIERERVKESENEKMTIFPLIPCKTSRTAK